MIDREELIKGTLLFIEKYKRLPFLKEDNLEVEKLDENNEPILKNFRALKYINEYFKNQDEYSKYLLDEEIITYKSIGEILNLTPTVVRNIIIKNTKNPDMRARRSLHIFFNQDFYKDDLPSLNDVCLSCTKQKSCGQAYWVDIISCKRYREKKGKK